MDKKTRIWILIFSALFLAAAGTFFAVKGLTGGTVAEVYSDGTLIRSLDLDSVVIPYDFTVETEYGMNVVHVQHGAISVSEADCPDRICVKQGSVTDSLIPIVCLPHHLVIQIREELP